MFLPFMNILNNFRGKTKQSKKYHANRFCMTVLWLFLRKSSLLIITVVVNPGEMQMWAARRAVSLDKVISRRDTHLNLRCKAVPKSLAMSPHIPQPCEWYISVALTSLLYLQGEHDVCLVTCAGFEKLSCNFNFFSVWFIL